MKRQGNSGTMPKLRFPEFKGRADWVSTPLSEASTPVTERVGDKKLTPVSISAGVGFVPQAEKFGRDISGEQYALYTVVRDGDFVYNKGNSLRFPQGCVYQLRGWGEVAAPNVFITFRLRKGFVAEYFQYCFEKNIHGVQLKKHITSGARSNGLLNLSREQFFEVSIPTPEQDEQQKIADCLTSLDDLIAAQGRKLEALKTLKRGLIQRLFPCGDEAQPQLRFAEFQSADGWKIDTLEHLCTAKISYGIVQAGPHVPNGMPYIKSSDLNSKLTLASLSRTSEAIAAKYRRSEVVPGDLVFSLRGNIGASQIVPQEIAVANLTQGTARMRTKGPSQFLLQALISDPVRRRIMAVSKGSTFQEISLEALRAIEISHPESDEQQRVADCFANLDDLLAVQTQALDALKAHKKGLMQRLLPSLEDSPA